VFAVKLDYKAGFESVLLLIIGARFVLACDELELAALNRFVSCAWPDDGNEGLMGPREWYVDYPIATRVP